jgi:hypothetical protein
MIWRHLIQVELSLYDIGHKVPIYMRVGAEDLLDEADISWIVLYHQDMVELVRRSSGGGWLHSHRPSVSWLI